MDPIFCVNPKIVQTTKTKVKQNKIRAIKQTKNKQNNYVHE